jgi:hypothetical protein
MRVVVATSGRTIDRRSQCSDVVSKKGGGRSGPWPRIGRRSLVGDLEGAWQRPGRHFDRPRDIVGYRRGGAGNTDRDNPGSPATAAVTTVPPQRDPPATTSPVDVGAGLFDVAVLGDAGDVKDAVDAAIAAEVEAVPDGLA